VKCQSTKKFSTFTVLRINWHVN